MQSLLRSHVPGWVGFAGAAGVLVSVLMLSGCPGTLDPALFNETGGSSGGGTGGTGQTGGTTGTGGTTVSCTGGNNGATVVMTNCAIAPCHDTADANTLGAGLDLTVNSTIASRLVDVVSPGNTAANSVCGGTTEPYLKSSSTPATGLLIQKIKSSPTTCSDSEAPPCCGLPMPYPGVVLLSAQQQTCLIQWATTLTSP